jgi:folate-binding protein YgfZ
MVSFEDYNAARHNAVVVVRPDRARLVVTGPDRASFLQGLLTNDVMALKAGEGCYAAYLTPQGRMMADVFVYELGDAMLLTVPAAQRELVLTKLDQVIFSEDVQLGDVTDTFTTMAVVGPAAAGVLSRTLAQPEIDLNEWSPHANHRGQFDGQPVILTRVVDTGEPGFDVHVDRSSTDALRAALVNAGAVAGDVQTIDAIRIEEGIPKFGQDMDDETIPLEAGIEARAISFSKGCYVGQEVIIRVLHRGHGRVARKLAGLLCEGGDVPAPGTTVHAADREIGEVRSSTMSPALARPVALAYLHRDFLTVGTSVSIAGRNASVAELPFVSR